MVQQSKNATFSPAADTGVASGRDISQLSAHPPTALPIPAAGNKQGKNRGEQAADLLKKALKKQTK